MTEGWLRLLTEQTRFSPACRYERMSLRCQWPLATFIFFWPHPQPEGERISVLPQFEKKVPASQSAWELWIQFYKTWYQRIEQIDIRYKWQGIRSEIQIYARASTYRQMGVTYWCGSRCCSWICWWSSSGLRLEFSSLVASWLSLILA